MSVSTYRVGAALWATTVMLALASSNSAASDAGAANRATTPRSLPVAATANRLPSPVSLQLPLRNTARTMTATRAAVRLTQVIVRLSEPSVAEAEEAAAGSGRTQRARVDAQQKDYVARMAGQGARMLGHVRNVANAVFLEVNAADMATMHADPAVLRIAVVRDYQTDLSETVPYIGARAVQDLGITGRGVRVAVLDSGIDYLHADLGGKGNPADFASNDPDVVEPGTFPTRKVIGGTDFVGGKWPGTAAEIGRAHV